MALYYYKKDRGQENVNDILGDYCGVIQSDHKKRNCKKEKLLHENPSFSKALWFVKQFDRIFKTEKKIKLAKHIFQEIEEIR